MNESIKKDFIEETVLRFAADENTPENWNVGSMIEFLEEKNILIVDII